MRYRSNPWPAFVDLFAALLIAALAGFILLTSEYNSEVTEQQISEQEYRQTFDRTLETIQKIRLALDKNRDAFKIEDFNPIGNEISYNLKIFFEDNKHEIKKDDELRLKEISTVLKSIIDTLPEESRQDVEIVIEGHTDDKLPKKFGDPKLINSYNWILSSERATSVLYEFTQNGIDSNKYQIFAAGYADTRPVCEPKSSEKCREQNRRTTLCLRPNTRLIDEKFRLFQQELK